MFCSSNQFLILLNYNCVCFSHGWILEHLLGPYWRKPNSRWAPHMPCVGGWLPTRGQYDVHIYCLALDSLEVEDVVFRTYKDRREVHPFEDIFCYSGWVLYGKQRLYRTYLSGLKGSTGLCRTSLEIQHLYMLFLQTRLYRLSYTSVCISFLWISGSGCTWCVAVNTWICGMVWSSVSPEDSAT